MATPWLVLSRGAPVGQWALGDLFGWVRCTDRRWVEGCSGEFPPRWFTPSGFSHIGWISELSINLEAWSWFVKTVSILERGWSKQKQHYNTNWRLDDWQNVIFSHQQEMPAKKGVWNSCLMWSRLSGPEVGSLKLWRKLFLDWRTSSLSPAAK